MLTFSQPFVLGYINEDRQTYVEQYIDLVTLTFDLQWSYTRGS